jgi:hypothetical protein
MSRETYNYKRRAVSTAKDLCYSEETISRLKSATTEIEIIRIMTNARKETN